MMNFTDICYLNYYSFTKMIKIFLLSLFIGNSNLLYCFSLNTIVILPDSIGSKIIDGKLFILHKVTNGENIPIVAKKYKITSGELKVANPKLKDWLYTDQILKIPVKQDVKVSFKDSITKVQSVILKKGNPVNGNIPVLYKVIGNETIEEIAIKYHLKPDTIKQWNKLSDSVLTANQELIVAWITTNKSTDSTIISNDSLRLKSIIKPVELNTQSNISSTEAPDKKKQIKSKKNKKKSKSELELEIRKKEIIESGIGIIANDVYLNTTKSYALHTKATIGSIIKVINPVNEQFTYVKVVGKIPENIEQSSNIAIMLSPIAVKSLQISAPNRFEIKLSYGIEE